MNKKLISLPLSIVFFSFPIFANINCELHYFDETYQINIPKTQNALHFKKKTIGDRFIFYFQNLTKVKKLKVLVYENNDYPQPIYLGEFHVTSKFNSGNHTLFDKNLEREVHFTCRDNKFHFF